MIISESMGKLIEGRFAFHRVQGKGSIYNAMPNIYESTELVSDDFGNKNDDSLVGYSKTLGIFKDVIKI